MIFLKEVCHMFYTPLICWNFQPSWPYIIFYAHILIIKICSSIWNFNIVSVCIYYVLQYCNYVLSAFTTNFIQSTEFLYNFCHIKLQSLCTDDKCMYATCKFKMAHTVEVMNICPASSIFNNNWYHFFNMIGS